MTFIDVLAAILSGLTLACIFIAVFIVIPTILNRLYKTPNLKDFRICRRLDGAFVVMAKNKLGFWRLLYNMCNGYLVLKSYDDNVLVMKSYRRESEAQKNIDDIVEIIKRGKVKKKSSKLKIVKRIKV
jgi:hypothetical protein